MRKNNGKFCILTVVGLRFCCQYKGPTDHYVYTHTYIHKCTHTHTHKPTHTHTLTHTHIHRECSGEGQYCSAGIVREEKCLDFAFEGRESSRPSDVLGEIVPDVRTKVGERAKVMNFAVEASDFEHARVC